MEMSSCVVELGDSAIRKVASKFETADNSGKGLISSLGNSSAPFGIATRVLGTSSDLSEEVIIRHTRRRRRSYAPVVAREKSSSSPVLKKLWF